MLRFGRLAAVAAVACFAVAALHGAADAQLVRDYWDYDPAVVRGFEEGPERDDIVPGEFIIDPPTLENLGFRWYIEGDSNRNATVEVSYRKSGEQAWREALPMHRVHHEVVNRFRLVRPDHPNPDRRDISLYYRTGNLFAGSVMFLEPGTEYEVRFLMTDPDGGAPEEPKTVSVATRSEPEAWDGGRTLRVYPADHEGARQAGAFGDIPSALEAARPGDIVHLQAGVHRLPETPFVVTQSGEAGRPIVLRGEGAERTVVEGDGHATDLFDVRNTEHIMFEDMTLRHARTAIQGGSRGGPGASWLTVRRCRIEDVINGIWTYSENSDNWYIADNVLEGIDPVWYPRTEPGRGYMDGSHTGVNVYGQGHVVCHNRITRFSDSLAVANYDAPSADNIHRHAVNIDFYNNDLSYAVDDTIETDYGCHNIRVYRNLNYNTHTALSVQPAYGGPIYLIRNVAYGISSLSYKWNNHPAGPIAYHNTTISGGAAFSTPPWNNGHLRNNLILGGGGTRISAGTLTPELSTMDYNGWNGTAVRWMHGREDPEELRDRWGRVHYDSFADFVERTGYGKNSIEVDFDIFVKAAPVQRGRTYAREHFDLRLRPGANAVDAGARLPNINDGFAGEAPDLGAYELGSEPPHYGPRNHR